jgi:hypothetical protein
MRVDEVTLTQTEIDDRSRRRRLERLIERAKAFKQQREHVADVWEGQPQRPKPPKSLDQQRVVSLQQQVDRAQEAVKTERSRQKIAGQTEKMNQSRAVIAKARQAIAHPKLP